MRKIILYSILLAYLLCSKLPANAQVGLFIRPNSSSLSSPIQGQTWLFNSTNNTMQVYNGSSFITASAPQNNYAATLAPTSANDNTQGYSPGSSWYNTSTSYIYQCVSAATSAAVWVQINNLGSLSIPLTALQSGSATTGQSLLWNGSHWAPGSPLVSFNNVLQTGAIVGQVPVWNGINWVPTTLSGGGGATITPTYVTGNNESASLPNSLQLQAGSGITLTPGSNSLTISAGGGGGAPVFTPNQVVVPGGGENLTPAADNIYFIDFTSGGGVTFDMPDATTCIGHSIVLINTSAGGASGSIAHNASAANSSVNNDSPFGGYGGTLAPAQGYWLFAQGSGGWYAIQHP